MRTAPRTDGELLVLVSSQVDSLSKHDHVYNRSHKKKSKRCGAEDPLRKANVRPIQVEETSPHNESSSGTDAHGLPESAERDSVELGILLTRDQRPKGSRLGANP